MNCLHRAGLAIVILALLGPARLCADELLVVGPSTGKTAAAVQILPVPSPKPPEPAEPVLAYLDSPPVGSVVAWLKSLPGTPRLPGGWVECNGQVVEDAGSPYFEKAVPNLNGADQEAQRFLRGAAVSGGTGGSATHRHGEYRSQKYGSQRTPVMVPFPANHLPPYYEVTWIMKIK